MGEFVCEGFEFFGNFDSANIAKVEFIPPNENIITSTHNNAAKQKNVEQIDIEFNIWTKPDCHGTEFENSYRTWFYFGMKANCSSVLVKLNLVDINKQQKMYGQGMCPVYKIVPGKANWERIHDKPTYNNDERSLSFKYRTPDNPESVSYFAFTYPFSYTDIQNSLRTIDSKYLSTGGTKDDIYYFRECVCFSLEGRKVDLLTITSYHNISKERETRLKHLFPEKHLARPFKFTGKPVIFVSARVHPGETPASFTFNGFLGLLLSRDDPVAVTLRRCYVFKLIPCLNPDGVAKGHYRTDTRGVNLNRMYLNCSIEYSPSIYAARALIRYYHFGVEKEDTTLAECVCATEQMDKKNVQGDRSEGSLSEGEVDEEGNGKFFCCNAIKNCCKKCGATISGTSLTIGDKLDQGDQNITSGLFLYIDMHGHASKKGIFMYGNHFESLDKKVECMLLPKLMSINNFNFHFNACNFTERNMYLKDKFDGLSKEGSGRVAVYKLTGLVKSYTLECNYNTGRMVNVLPATIRENAKNHSYMNAPPKYTPHVFEEAGRALGTSILDLTGQNPVTRLPNSEYRSIVGLQEWLYLHCTGELGDPRAVSRWRVRQLTGLHSQVRNSNRLFKGRSSVQKSTVKRIVSKKPLRTTSVPANRKENTENSKEASSSSTSLLKSKTRSRVFSAGVRTKAKGLTKAIPSVPNLVQSVTKNTKNHIVHNMENTKCLLKQKMRLDPAAKVVESTRLSPDRIKLHEIHFIKDEEGKKVIAKYKSEEEEQEMINDSLVVAWETNNSQPHVFSQKSSNLKILTPLLEPGETARKGSFRVHNFTRVLATKKKNLFKTSSDISVRKDKIRKRKSKTNLV